MLQPGQSPGSQWDCAALAILGVVEVDHAVGKVNTLSLRGDDQLGAAHAGFGSQDHDGWQFGRGGRPDQPFDLASGALCFRDASKADVVVEATFPGIVDGGTVYKLKRVDQGPVLPSLPGHCI